MRYSQIVSQIRNTDLSDIRIGSESIFYEGRERERE